MLKDFTELLHVAVSVLVTALVITVSVALFRLGSATVRNFTNDINNKNAAVEEADYTKYANGECTGSDVVSAIRKYRDDVLIQVQTKNAPGMVKNFTSTSLASSFQNIPTSEYYVNPGAFFNCTIIRAANGNITTLKFVQTESVSIVSADINTVVETGGTGTGGGAVGTPFSLRSRAASDSDDLEILFSDEEDSSPCNTGTGDEASQFAKDLSEAIMNYSSQLDDLAWELDGLDLDKTNSSVLSDFITKLNALSDNLDLLEADCNSAFLTASLQKKYRNMLEKVRDRLQEAVAIVDDYKQKLASLKDSQDTWYVGSPVREDVKVKLTRNGTLIFSGKGGTDTGHDLPKWLNRKKDIKKVVFGDRVAPINVDYWFSGCINLKTVKNLPDTVQSMNGVFFDCPALGGYTCLGGSVVSANALRNTGDATLTLVVPENSQTMETIEAYLALDTSKNANIKTRKG